MQNRCSVIGTAVLSAFALAPASQAATVTVLEDFDPVTYFDGNFLAGIDFDDDSSGDPGIQTETQAGFTSVAPSNNKSYSEVSNGITFDVEVTNANLGNQNRYRGAGALATAGPLLADFEQWYGRYATAGNATEAAITISGLTPGNVYEVSVFTANVGAGQTTHLFYDGASSAAPLLGTVTTAGSNNDIPGGWDPGAIVTGTADINGEIVFTVQATEFTAGSNIESRLTIAGISIVPEPSSLALLAMGGLAVARRRR